MTLICAKFDEDLLNIFKVACRKTKCLSFLRLPCSRFGLAWSRPRADRGLSQSTSVIPYSNKCVQNFIQIG